MADNKQILLNLQIQTDKANAALKRTEVEIKKTIQSFRSLTKGSLDYQAAQAKLANQQATLAQQTIKYNNALKVQTAAQANAVNQTRKMSGATGGATTSVLEFGRVLSDAPYGIRGVANNLSQLASNMLFTSQQTDKVTGKVIGFSGVLKQMGKAFMGPLGILVAIQGALALLEAFSDKIGEASNQMADFAGDSITEAIAELTVLKKVLEDENISLERKTEMLGKAGEEYEGLADKSIDTKDAMALVVLEIDKMIDAMKRTAFAEAVLTALKDNMVDIAKQMAKGVEDFGTSLEGSIALATDALGVTKNAANANYAETLSEISEENEKLMDILKADDGALALLLYGDDKKEGKKGDKRIRQYKQQLLDLTKFTLDQQKQEEILIERSKFKQLLITQDYAHRDLLATKKSYLAKNKVRYENFIAESKDEKAKAKALQIFEEANIKAESEYQAASDALMFKNAEEKNLYLVKLEEKHQSDMIKAKGTSNKATLGRAKGFAKVLGADGAEGLAQAMETAGAVDDELFQKALDIKEEQMRMAGNTEEQIAAEIGEMTYQNDLARAQREIDIEQMKIDAKMKINQEYIGWSQGLTSIFKSIAGENEDLAKAALFLEKGAAIAGIIVNTQASNAKIISASTAEAAGYNSAAAQTAASLGGGIQGAAAALPYITKAKNAVLGGKKRITKNNIGAGISIASILATTLSSKGSTSNSGGGASGGGGQSRNFDFNLVGNTGQNQLAQGIASQFNQPVQAYVVGSQITSQQQLDATIQSNASIG